MPPSNMKEIFTRHYYSVTLQDDPDTLLKCLTIASEMLQRITRNELNPTLTTLMETLVSF